ncbi:TonB-dependent receptor (plasmid) [Flammeovirga pectinis]|uniref:TonB-dependent receptor n=1 Tax=Flammeovirga pectinis TaxID=2494373 RepID=A0A3S9PBV1_9BACT|nr:carboxypeptidase-like regulatory domain-containing protein [Flammeovirga pectinis]AZQ65647.1 TonB-dependent receptor [Flammeovirga pectinis]
MKNYLLLLFLLKSTIILAQTPIHGVIKNQKGEPINGASIIIYPVKSNSILGYCVSNNDGLFEISINEKLDSISVIARSLGYKSSTKVVKLGTNTIVFTMDHSDQYLKEFEVKAKPITEEGDTLNYNVDAFSKEGDESIEDVLKRLPGVKVSDDGTIQYQGRAINKFYVEGKDLMGSQYALTSKNLPKNAVASVEVLKNHQPVKMLNDVVHSVDPAINIVLKEGVSITGNAEIGGGIPSIWYAKVTPMVFNKKRQSINVLSSTNSGKNELEVFNSINLFDYLEFGLIESQPSFLLGRQPLESSLFKKQEYNDHQTHSVSTNYLTGFGKGDLKVNIDAYYDKRVQDLSSNTFYFVPNDTIAIHNFQQSTFNKKYLNTKLTYEHNELKNYFKNVFHFKILDDDGKSDFYQNQEIIPQTTSRTFLTIGDKFSRILKMGKTYYKLNAYLEYTNTPEQLHFIGGPLTDASLIDSLQTVEQKTSQQHLKTYLGTGIIKKWKRWTLDTKISLNYGFKTLTSHFDNDEKDQNSSYQNDLKYMLLIPEISPEIQYKYKKLSFSLKPNFSFQSRILKDHMLGEESQVHQFLIEPTTLISYTLLGIDLMVNYNYKNDFLELPQMYSGIIIHDYSTAKQQQLPILQTKRHTFRNDLKYEFTAASLNFYANYEFNSTNKDWITAYEVNSDGVTLMKTLNYTNNLGESHKIKGNFDWFFLALSTNIKLGVELGKTEEKVILNNNVNRNANTYLQWEAIVDIPLFKGLIATTYIEDYSTENTYQEMNKVDWSQRIIGTDLQFSRAKHLIKWNNKWIDHTFVDDDFWYVDLSYQYQFNKKTRMLLTAQNILDHRSYTQTTLNAFQSNQSFYRLRPRQIMLEVRFRL